MNQYKKAKNRHLWARACVYYLLPANHYIFSLFIRGGNGMVYSILTQLPRLWKPWYPKNIKLPVTCLFLQRVPALPMLFGISPGFGTARTIRKSYFHDYRLVILQTKQTQRNVISINKTIKISLLKLASGGWYFVIFHVAFFSEERKPSVI